MSTVTKKQALEALSNLDDFARMETGVDAYGPRILLERYIEATSGLSFNTLRDANVRRLKDSKYKKCEDEWTTAHWMQATVGELGELANILKKVDRGDFTLSQVKKDIAKECADVQTYLDIMAFKLGVDLGYATIWKFNEVSKRIGSPVYIGVDDTIKGL